jgi:hypothetical protein
MGDDALDNVKKVEVSASRKKQLDQYEPATSHVSFTAEVPEGADVEDFVKQLQDRAGEMAKNDILRKYEAYVKRELEDVQDDE